MKAPDAGAAHNGLQQWYWQRASAIVLLLCLPYPIYELLLVMHGAVGFDFVNTVSRAFLVTQSLLLLAMMLHIYTGVLVILEDYIHTTRLRAATVLILQISLLALFVDMAARLWRL
ncbi:MAG: succinate dehydrogenase, hydrophobic membrane anchor protein [Mariprofundales bacterium]